MFSFSFTLNDFREPCHIFLLSYFIIRKTESATARVEVWWTWTWTTQTMAMTMLLCSTNLGRGGFILHDLAKTRKQDWIVSETLAGKLTVLTVGIGTGPRALSDAEHALYHWATPPAPRFLCSPGWGQTHVLPATSQGCGIRGVSSPHVLAKISFKIEYVRYFILGRNEV